MSLEVNSDRRRFLRTSAMAFLASDWAMTSPAKADVKKTAAETFSPIKRGTHTSFASLKQVKAGALSVGYAETGPVDGPVVILLHGWPYDIYAYADVAPALGSAGYRVITPYLRGFGPTRFLSAEAFRNGEQLAVSIRSRLWTRSRSIERS